MQSSTRGQFQKGDRARELSEGHSPLTSTSSFKKEAAEGDVWDRRRRGTLHLGATMCEDGGGGMGCPQINAVGWGKGWAHGGQAGLQRAE